MSARSLAFGTGDWELAGWITPSSFTQRYATLFASNHTTWSPGARFLMLYGLGAQGEFPRKLAMGGNGIGNPAVQTSPLEVGVPYYARFQRVAGVLRIFLDEVLQGSAPDSTEWNFVRAGDNGWDGAHSWLDALLSGWTAKTTGISTVPGVRPTPPAPATGMYGSIASASAALDAVFGQGGVSFRPNNTRFAVLRPEMLVGTGLIGRDLVNGGTGKVTGTVHRYVSPSSQPPQRARVTLLRADRGKQVAAVVWSDPATGAFEAPGLDTSGRQYIALAEYPSNPSDPTAAGYMRPVAGVSKVEVS